MRIGLLSDTHSFLNEKVFYHFKDCDEIWHAGDVGAPEVLDALTAFKPVRAVYGNIDDSLLRARLPLNQLFTVEGLKVFMTHIGGYPGGYTPRVRAILDQEQVGLYICGHSHILKVMPDKKRHLLHMNPGAAGVHGFHQICTLLRFEIAQGKLQEVEVIEMGARGGEHKSFG